MKQQQQHSQPEGTPQGDESANTKHPQHEGGEPVGRNDSHSPRSVGEQGRRDIESGMQDTDRRGGGEYQQRTGNDAQANENSRGNPASGAAKKEP
ncbi:hypothetical protein [Paraburkholderia sp. J41]|uniref:hypothetical protein n=1 Tax=Paraburkholderia sp. J41 TaxID=2805433 RepID=UPI002AC33FF4|nr:hypothetical protein [Paraburkholderia sp. J41]